MPKSSPIEMDGRARMCQLNDSLEEAAKFLKCALTINLSPNWGELSFLLNDIFFIPNTVFLSVGI